MKKAEDQAREKIDTLLIQDVKKKEVENFYEKHVKEKGRRRAYIDASNYLILYFQTKEQIEYFLEKIGFDLKEDLIDGQYLNGFQLAEKLDIEIKKLELKDLGLFQKSKAITDDHILDSKHYQDGEESNNSRR